MYPEENWCFERSSSIETLRCRVWRWRQPFRLGQFQVTSSHSLLSWVLVCQKNVDKLFFHVFFPPPWVSHQVPYETRSARLGSCLGETRRFFVLPKQGDAWWWMRPIRLHWRRWRSPLENPPNCGDSSDGMDGMDRCFQHLSYQCLLVWFVSLMFHDMRWK